MLEWGIMLDMQLQDDIPSQIEHANLPTSSPPSSSPPHIFSSPPPFSSQVSAPSSPDRFSLLQTERKLVLRLPALSVGLDATKNDATLDLPAALDPMNPTNIALGLGDYDSKSSATTSAKSSQTLSLPDLPYFSSPSGAGLTHSPPAPRVGHSGDHLDNITPLDFNWSAKSTSPSDSLMPLFAASDCLLPSPLTTNEYLVPLDQHPLRSASPLLDMSSPIINLAAVTDAQNDEQDLDPKQSALDTTPLGSFDTTCQRLIEDDPESPAATSTGSNTTSKSSDDTTNHQSAMDSPQPKITPSTSIDNSQQANTKNKTRWAMGTDEPTPSPMSVPTTEHSMTGKRKREDEAISHGSHDVATSHIDSPTRRPEIPNPKRPTQAAQRLQRQKLTTPFRSPVVRKVIASTEATRKTLPLPQTAPAGAKSENHASGNGSGLEEAPRISELDTKKRHRTTRAAAQFKSPLSTQASTGMPSIRLTPTIQSLDRKIQILKRALKVKQGNEEAMLESLVKKWKEAGREVAWEVWELVKDNASSDDSVWGKSKAKKTTFGGSWGWDSQEEQSRGAQKERNWGWDTTPNTGTDDGPRHMSEETKVESDDEEKVQDTLGTMLRQLGIDPDTLGWNEDEGTFVDKDEQ
ncbi:hypothetical protein BD779DRAFT_1465539 [Infundibulicybe gibba]|nr:hypothetical protein BD779DRAFT_1465539 [Infundibulicybe gibba]